MQKKIKNKFIVILSVARRALSKGYLLPLILLSSCTPHKKLKPTDPGYIPRKERRELRKQDRVIARCQMQCDELFKKYAYEMRMLAKIEKQNLFEIEKEEKLKKEIKKIICLKSNGAYYGTNYGPFIYYKETLERDIQSLNVTAAQLESYNFEDYESLEILSNIQTFLANLDQIFDVIYLDFEVVRDLQLAHMSRQIKSLESEKNDLSEQLKEKMEQPLTVVINNSKSDQIT